MRAGLTSPALAMAALGGLIACEPVGPDAENHGVFAPEYLGVETRLLDSDLVSFQVRMKGARDRADVARYAECAAAQYTLIRGYGFARHLRTNIDEKGGVWSGDAVYTISPALPQGLATIDAEVKVQDCTENGIPTV